MRKPYLTQLIGVVMLAVGLGIVVFGAYLAYSAYVTYKPLLPVGSTLEESITNTVYELLNLVIKLGFLGAMIWAGSIVLSRGVDMVRAKEGGEGRGS